MSVHLHSIIDDIRNDRPLMNSFLQEDLRTNGYPLSEWWGHELAMMQQAVCFDGGDAELITVPHRQELCRLPYPVTWIEFLYRFPDTPMRVGFLCRTLTDERLEINVYQNPPHPSFPKRWALMYQSRIRFLGGEYPKERREISYAPSNMIAHDVEADSSIVLCFLTALNCCNVRRVEHTPAIAINKKRERAGRPPLFSYWTLQLAPDVHEAVTSTGGTHASPRIHLRRGHIRRRHGSDKWWWVQPHVVGRKDLGMVHKDYDARQVAEVPA